MSLRTSTEIMRSVIMALVPAMTLLIWSQPQFIFVLFAACLGSVLAELVCIRLQYQWFLARQRIQDCSAVLTGLLLALCLPATTPLWQVFIGGAVASIFGKQLYGGLGKNPFNPAMVGYVFLLLGFPSTVTQWPLPDGTIGPTLLDRAYTSKEDFPVLFFHTTAVSMSSLLGGLYLYKKKVIGARIPISTILSFFVTILCVSIWQKLGFVQALTLATQQLWLGGLIFGAVFIATDPVSAPLGARPQIVYGLCIGTLTALIRSGAQYPDGVAFAVLVANCLGPSLEYIDRYLGAGRA